MDTKNSVPTEERIVKILEVLDTRRYEEVEPDKWKPIPGTGIENECDRCNKVHEVHVRVLLDSGRQAVIGTGCARNESMDVQSRIKSSVSAVMTVKRLMAERDKLSAESARFYAAVKEVRSRQIPTVSYAIEGQREVWTMGDAKVWVSTWADKKERMDCLVSNWQNNRLREEGFTRLFADYPGEIKDLEKRIRRAQAKIED